MSDVQRRSDYRVARIWRGRVSADRADEYADYIAEAGISVLAKAALGVEQFRDDQDGVVEFVTISYWESVDAMSWYTRAEPGVIHHLDRDEEFLLEMPQAVQVLHLTESHWSPEDRP